MSSILAKKLTIIATELNPEYDTDLNGAVYEESGTYSFPAWEFSNGLILCPEKTTCDSFFPNRRSIEPHGAAVAKEIIEGNTEEWDALSLAQALGAYTREYGASDTTKKGWELLKNGKN